MTKLIEFFRKYMFELDELCTTSLITDYEDMKQIGRTKIYYMRGFKRKLNELNEIIFEMNKEIRELCSQDNVKSKLDDIIEKNQIDKIKLDEKIINRQFKQLLSECKEATRFLTLKFIINLKIDKPFTFGNITLKPYSEKQVKAIYQKNAPGFIEDEGFNFFLENIVLRNEKYICYTTIEVTANDTEKAYEKATDSLNQVLNILRFFSSEKNFGICGEFLPPLVIENFLINLNTNLPIFTVGYDKSTLPTYIRNLSRIKRLKFYSNLDKIIKKDEKDRSLLENKLLGSIYWYNEALRQPKNYNEKLLKIYIAFETLLLRHKEEKKFCLMNRIPFIANKKSEQRRNIYYLIKKTYKTRNDIIHEGNGFISEWDCDELLYTLEICIYYFGKYIKEYPTLDDWVELIESDLFKRRIGYQRKWSLRK